MSTEINILSLDEILDAADVSERELPIPEWGGYVVVRSVTKREMDEIKKRCKDVNDELDEDAVEKALVITGLVNPKIDDAGYERLLDKSMGAMQKISSAIVKGSGATEKAVKEAERTFPA
jgi:hypothetical protein